MQIAWAGFPGGNKALRVLEKKTDGLLQQAVIQDAPTMKIITNKIQASLALILAAACLMGCANSAPGFGLFQSASNEATFRPTVDRRDVITATGYAVIDVQNSKSAPQQRLLAIRAAKIDAYRGLAEQVYGLYLDANTTVAEATVTRETFRTRVEGVIFGATLTSISPMNNDTYEVTLSIDRVAVNDLRLLYQDQVGVKRR